MLTGLKENETEKLKYSMKILVKRMTNLTISILGRRLIEAHSKALYILAASQSNWSSD